MTNRIGEHAAGSEATPARRPFGPTGLQLSPLGLGCWQFSKGQGMIGRFWNALDDDTAKAIVRVSLEGGINWFDTAEIYGGGASEEALDEALHAAGELVEDVHIATKWWPFMRTSANIPKTIRERSRRLGGRRIDLYMVHQPWSLSSVSSEMRQMGALAEQGLIGNVGVSNFSAKQMREADRTLRSLGLRLASNQVKYSLLDRRIEQNGILETAQELGAAIIAYSPLEQGVLSGKFHSQPELARQVKGMRRMMMGALSPAHLAKSAPLIQALERLGAKYMGSATQAALNWLIHANGDTVFAIPGASKTRHAEENVRAMSFRLTADEIHELDLLSRRAGAKL